MKKKILSALFFSFIATFVLPISQLNAKDNVSDFSYVENHEVSLPFFFGERTGLYTGSIKNGLPCGVGEFKTQNTDGVSWIYIGEWIDGHLEGKGTSFFDNGDIKTGTYSKDYLSGDKCLMSSSAGTYFGELNNEIVSGKGTSLTLTERYVGEFKDNLYGGYGTLYYENGQRYEGNFSNGQINGDGSFFFTDGSHVTGSFATNKDTGLLDGEGIFYYANGTSNDCIYESGNIIFPNSEPIASSTPIPTPSPVPTPFSSPTPVPSSLSEADQRLANATIFKADVYNGTGTDIIGKRAYIIIPKDTLKQISEKDYANFLNTKVKDSGYNWFSIICDDGTGICFAGSFTNLGTYGKINKDGSITEAIGNISATENGYKYEPIN